MSLALGMIYIALMLVTIISICLQKSLLEELKQRDVVLIAYC